jgi:hypothetical protein
MDKFTRLAESVCHTINENAETQQAQSAAIAFRDEFYELYKKYSIDDISLQEYNDKYDMIKTKAKATLDAKAPIWAIDPEKAGEFSDDYKSENGVRPNLDQWDEQEVDDWTERNRSSSEDGESLASTVRPLDGFFTGADQPYISDEESTEEGFLTPDQTTALNTAKSLATKPKGGINPFNKPQKQIDKALGDMYSKVANKVTKVSSQIK